MVAWYVRTSTKAPEALLINWCRVIAIVFTAPQFLLAPPFLFSLRGAAAAWAAPIIGCFVGQIWGHWFNDFLCRRYIRRHNGKYVLENRLWGTYGPVLLMFTAFVLYGQAIQHALHWIVLLLAWAFLTSGFIATTTAVSAYALDCFPFHASIVASIINFWRTTGGK